MCIPTYKQQNRLLCGQPVFVVIIKLFGMLVIVNCYVEWSTRNVRTCRLRGTYIERCSYSNCLSTGSTHTQRTCTRWVTHPCIYCHSLCGCVGNSSSSRR